MIDLPPAKGDLHRPADWRWLRANWLIKHNAVKAEKDPLVRKIIKFIQAMADKTSVMSLIKFKEQEEGLYQAHEIYQNSNRGVRWAVEARLLARQSFAEIAGLTGTTVHCISCYEMIYFNVSDRLDASDYIASIIIGEAMHKGINPRDYNLLWKLYAYLGGVHILNAVIAGRADNELTRLWFENDAANTLAVKHSITARTVPIAFNHAVVFDAYAKLKAAQRASESGDSSGSEQLKIHVRDMLEAYGTAVSGGLYRPTDSDRYAKYDDAPAELRADDMLKVNAGLTPALGSETLVFPDPPPKVEKPQ